jgi:hypothetical protein
MPFIKQIPINEILLYISHKITPKNTKITDHFSKASSNPSKVLLKSITIEKTTKKSRSQSLTILTSCQDFLKQIKIFKRNKIPEGSRERPI